MRLIVFLLTFIEDLSYEVTADTRIIRVTKMFFDSLFECFDTLLEFPCVIGID
jgi:hypothetical protein